MCVQEKSSVPNWAECGLSAPMRCGVQSIERATFQPTSLRRSWTAGVADKETGLLTAFTNSFVNSNCIETM
eukprot:5711795-Amphidinium_carterae.1